MKVAAPKLPKYAVRITAEVIQVLAPDGTLLSESGIHEAGVRMHSERWAALLNQAMRNGYELGRGSALAAVKKGGAN